MKSCASFVVPLQLLLLGVVSSFHLHVPIQRRQRQASSALFMANNNKVGVFFGTSTGSTETVAEMIAEKLGAEGPFDVDGNGVVASFLKYDSLIVGTPTWNTGADSERSGTGWDELYYRSMTDLDLTGKKVAVFGLGDSVSYAENYADAAGELHDVFEKLGCKMFGYVSTEGYLHEDSKSIRGDKFCGLLLDMVNQEELTEERVDNWVAQLESEGFLNGDDSSSSSSSSVQDSVVVSASTIMPDSPIMVNSQVTFGATISTLEENSTLLYESIASHDTGFTPHTNRVTGRTMWTSADGTKCYVTQGTKVTTSATQSTTYSA